MNETKLSDFTFPQLLFASMRFKEILTECNNKIELILKFEDGDTKHDLLFHWMAQRDFASIWLTQVDYSLLEAKKREMIQSTL